MFCINLNQPSFNRKLYTYGPVYLGANAGLAGLIANSLYRRALNVTQGRFASGLPMSVLPFLTTVALYNATVSNPLLTGKSLVSREEAKSKLFADKLFLIS